MNTSLTTRIPVPSRALQRPLGSSETVRRLQCELEEIGARVDLLRGSVSLLLLQDFVREGDQIRDILHLNSRLEGISQLLDDADRDLGQIVGRCAPILEDGMVVSGEPALAV